jgi:outer membrane lipoprotein-sorting protein
MAKNIYYTFLLFCFCLQSVSAQSDATAQKLLSDLLTSIKSTAVKTDFRLTMTMKGSPSQTANGTFTLKGSKFVLDMNQLKVYFNGITQWSYMAQNNEVTISSPSSKELSETNPMAILVNYSSKSNINFTSETKSSKNHCIEMIPNAKDKDISKITVQVSKSTNDLSSIKVIYKNGNVNSLILNSFKKGVQVNDNFFEFNKANFKEVVVNDLR